MKNNIVIIHTDQSGYTNYYVNGDDVSFVMVDDNFADPDRCFERVERDDIATIQELIPEGSVIGSSEDDRHAAVVARLSKQPFGVINGGKADSE